MASSTRPRRGFVAFYRRYTKTWIHALATAALTAFGMLTFVHRGFAVVAVALYVLPPIVLYLREPDPVRDGVGTISGPGTSETDPAGTAAADASETPSEAEAGVRREPSGWTAVDVPTDATLLDAAIAGARAFAVGEDGVVLADDAADGWHVALADGPGADSLDLRGADATADGGAVWFAGDGGSLGRLDVDVERHADHSAPSGITDNWTDVAVAGPTGDETLVLVNGSGQVLRGRYRDGDLAWDAPTKPGSGSSLSAATLADPSTGYFSDTSGAVFETEDGGESFRRIGIESTDGAPTDVAAAAPGDPAVVDDDGVHYRYDDGNWTPVRLGDGPLRALACCDDRSVACGDGGVVHERTGTADGWERVVTPATGSLRGVALNAGRAVAVGEDGAVVERHVA